MKKANRRRIRQKTDGKPKTPLIPTRLKNEYDRRVNIIHQQIVLLEVEARRAYSRSINLNLRETDHAMQRNRLVAPELPRRKEDVAEERRILRSNLGKKAKKAAFLKKAESLWNEIDGLEKDSKEELRWFRRELHDHYH